jgi:hypothetical protein
MMKKDFCFSFPDSAAAVAIVSSFFAVEIESKRKILLSLITSTLSRAADEHVRRVAAHRHHITPSLPSISGCSKKKREGKFDLIPGIRFSADAFARLLSQRTIGVWKNVPGTTVHCSRAAAKRKGNVLCSKIQRRERACASSAKQHKKKRERGFHQRVLLKTKGKMRAEREGEKKKVIYNEMSGTDVPPRSCRQSPSPCNRMIV